MPGPRAILSSPKSLFFPSDISGLVLWYDAEQITPQTDNTALTAWADFSGSGKHLSQPTSNRQPTYQVAEINGLPAVQFDGGDLMFAGSGLGISQPSTFFMVAKMDSAPTGQRRLLDNGAGTCIPLYANLSGGAWGTYAGTQLSGPAYDTSWHITNVVHTSGGANSKIRVGGGAGNTGSVGATAFSAGIVVGADGGSTPSLAWHGAVFAILVYNSALSLTDINRVGSYYAGRTALAWSTAT